MYFVVVNILSVWRFPINAITINDNINVGKHNSNMLLTVSRYFVFFCVWKFCSLIYFVFAFSWVDKKPAWFKFFIFFILWHHFIILMGLFTYMTFEFWAVKISEIWSSWWNSEKSLHNKHKYWCEFKPESGIKLSVRVRRLQWNKLHCGNVGLHLLKSSPLVW